ncbi:MAG: hypothetical protein ACRCTN_11960 [Carnobacterium maltaromaticum]
MEKISTINRLQKFMIAFLASVMLNLLSTLIPTMGMITVIISWTVIFLSIVTYILLWVSYANSRKDDINSKKYLLLVIILTVLTVVSMVGTLAWSVSLAMPLIESGITNPTTEQMMAMIPNYSLFSTILMAIGVVSNIIYLGLGAMIFLENKKMLEVAKAEHNSAFGE